MMDQMAVPPKAAPAASGLADDGLPPPGAPDIEIARAATMKPILGLAETRLGLAPEDLIPHGHYIAKLSHAAMKKLADKPRGQLVLVTAVTPTAAGEGKTTTSVGLNDGLNLIGMKSMVCLREPSLGPCFGMKGGAAGGGRSQIVPMEDINLHFTGDFHAITSAHNLLSAAIDNHLQWGNELELDPRRVTWRRVVDLNDRALRNITIGQGGPAHGVPREDGFDITVASEVMAIFCLANDLEDLQQRLGDIIIGYRRDKSVVRCRDLGVEGAMTALLKDALQPNLVQSISGNLAFVHGGPFANIAHGCNSVLATKAALALNDVVVTEAGFGADLGAEKFLDIKCRQSGLRPDAVVLVCTLRALKMQGGVAQADLKIEDVDAVRRGAQNLKRHIYNLGKFGLTPTVAVNHFVSDTEAERAVVEEICAELGVKAILSEHWGKGAEGARELAAAVQEKLSETKPDVSLLYEDDISLEDKIRRVATKLYAAADLLVSPKAAKDLQTFEDLGYGHMPVCIAKTQYSFSADPGAKGAPQGHILPVREVRLSAGAGFIVAVCGDIMTMPGLPRKPSALHIGVDAQGEIFGLS